MKKYISLGDAYLKQTFSKAVSLPPRLSILKEKKVQQSAASILGIDVKAGQNFLNILKLSESNGAWTQFQQSIFDRKKTGGGRGEYSVASFVTDIEPTASLSPQETLSILDDCVSGQSESFDVAVPPESKTYKFEVKEIEDDGSVRIGAEGKTATNRIVNGIMQILNDLENVYLSLDNNSKLQVDELMRKQLGLEAGLKEPEKPKKETKKYQQAYSQYSGSLEAAKNWTLRGFINAIYQSDEEEGRGIRELPASLIQKDAVIRPGDFKNPERRKYFLRNLQQVFDAIETIAGSSSSFTVQTHDKAEELKNIVRKLYLPNVSDETKKKEELEFLDHEVDTLDRKLTKRKCSIAGLGCLDAKDFFNSVRKMRLLSRLNGVQNLFKDPNIIRKLFPTDITGLFIVSKAGFSYYSKDTIDQFIEINQVSAGGIKIIKKVKQQET